MYLDHSSPDRTALRGYSGPSLILPQILPFHFLDLAFISRVPCHSLSLPSSCWDNPTSPSGTPFQCYFLYPASLIPAENKGSFLRAPCFPNTVLVRWSQPASCHSWDTQDRSPTDRERRRVYLGIPQRIKAQWMVYAMCPCMFIHGTEMCGPCSQYPSKNPWSQLEENPWSPAISLLWVLRVLRMAPWAVGYLLVESLIPGSCSSPPTSLPNAAEPHRGQAPGIFAFKHLTFAFCYPFIRTMKIERESSEAGLPSFLSAGTACFHDIYMGSFF